MVSDEEIVDAKLLKLAKRSLVLERLHSNVTLGLVNMISIDGIENKREMVRITEMRFNLIEKIYNSQNPKMWTLDSDQLP